MRGLSAKAVSALERGERRRPYPHTVRALAAGLGLSIEEYATLMAAVSPRGQRQMVGDAPASAGVAPVVLPVVAADAADVWLVGRQAEMAELLSLLDPAGVEPGVVAI